MHGLYKHLLTHRRAALTAVLSVIALAVPASASASSTQEMVMQDDPQLLGDPTAMVAALNGMKQVGVDRVRVSLFWNHVAPSPRSQKKPAFKSPGAGWPGAYPKGSWAVYDRIAFAAQQIGIGLLFTVTGPAPNWATPGVQRKEGIYKPNTSDFKQFVRAAAIRYSGAYPINDGDAPPRGGLTIGGITIGGNNPPPAAAADRIPRVDHWSIWNEPGYPSWLLPMWLNNKPKKKADMVAVAPHHYRKLVDAAWSSLVATGHRNDVILIGETSPRGGKDPKALGNAMAPAEFVREMYCLQKNFKPYKGKAARLRNCPDTAAKRRKFRGAHPGLFQASGYAHHPYSLNTRKWELPTWHHKDPDNISIGNIRKLTTTLDRAQFYWGSLRPPMNIWFTEYGYQTTPPDPTAGVAPDRQGPLSSWGEYIAYRNPRVASIAQFLLIDDGPVRGAKGRSRWVSWQSGLFLANGHPKPFLQDFQRPLYVIGKGRNLKLFGTYRPGEEGKPIGVGVQYLKTGAPGTAWQYLSTAIDNNPRGYITLPAKAPGSGFLRLIWLTPAGNLEGTRPIAVR